MNKRVVAISVLLLMMLAITASVFAQDNQQVEREYSVTVSYQQNTGGFRTFTYTIWAYSAREAEAKAMELCKYDVEVKKLGTVASCGAAIATGKSR